MLETPRLYLTLPSLGGVPLCTCLEHSLLDDEFDHFIKAVPGFQIGEYEWPRAAHFKEESAR